jgi:pimeloyl-ACP methyl ester carboxylesterase
MGIRERSMETARGRMAWLEAGAGWPVVLLHGFPLTADMWRPQLEAVPDGWRFIAPDFRGFGRFLPPSGGGDLTMDDYAADVFALMDSLELDDAVIGGLSMGGYVTFAMHRLGPARFTGMILADTRPQADTPQGRDGRVKLRAVLGDEGPRGVAAQMLPKLLGEEARQEGADALRETRRMIEQSAPAAIDAAIGALMGRPDSTPGLPAIACPTLVLVGEHDEITPVADAEAMQRLIPRAALCVIPGAGHLSSLEQPAVFSRGLADFLVARL